MKDNLQQEITWLLNEKYGGRLSGAAERDITRLKKGEPVDYVIGYKNFCGCKIDLRYRPLIPREETEFWVERAVRDTFLRTAGKPSELAALMSSPRSSASRRTPCPLGSGCSQKSIPNRFSIIKCLDIFAGSGCCGIAVLKNIPNSHCDFCDIDDNCLKQTRLNLKISKIPASRYRTIKSNIFYSLPTTCYSLILANSPYIAFNQKSRVQKSVLSFEPKNALFAKNNGLYFIEKFLRGAKNYLAPGGVIYLEFGYNQKKDIEKLLREFNYKNFEFHRDQFGKWRWLEITNNQDTSIQTNSNNQ